MAIVSASGVGPIDIKQEIIDRNVTNFKISNPPFAKLILLAIEKNRGSEFINALAGFEQSPLFIPTPNSIKTENNFARIIADEFGADAVPPLTQANDTSLLQATYVKLNGFFVRFEPMQKVDIILRNNGNNWNEVFKLLEKDEVLSFVEPVIFLPTKIQLESDIEIKQKLLSTLDPNSAAFKLESQRLDELKKQLFEVDSKTELATIEDEQQIQITHKEPVTFQDELIIDESKTAKEISEPSTTPTPEKLDPPKLDTGKLEGTMTDKDFTGQPSTLEKETKISKKQEQKAIIVLGTVALIVALVGTILYVKSKGKK